MEPISTAFSISTYPNRTVTVQPDVANLANSQAVAEHGFNCAPDPSTQIACSIDGDVAENSGIR